MRILILVLAILLLPLRGWIGDAMATQVAVQAVRGTPAAATSALEAPHAMHSMEGMAHDEAAPDEPHAQDASSHDCQSTCSSCQLCHSVAMTFQVAVPMLSEAPRGAPAGAISTFASADTARGLKPPIS